LSLIKSIRIPLVLLVVALVVAPLVGCVGQPASQGFSGIVSDGELLYLGSADGGVLAVNPSARAGREPFPSTGEWVYAVTTTVRGTFGCGTSQVPSTLYGTPALSDGRVAIGTYDGKVLMIDSQSRTANLVFPQVRAGEWQYPRTEDSIGPVVGSPAVVNDTVFVSSSMSEGNRTVGVVYALDKAFGDELWVSEALDGKLWITPVVVDGVVYVSTFDGRIYSLDAETGTALPWMYQGEFGFVSSPVIADDVLYVGSFDRNLHAIPLGGTAPIWRLEADNWFWGTPLVVNGQVYAASLDGKLYAVDGATGMPLWVEPYDADDGIAAAPVQAGESVVVVTMSGNVHVIDMSTGMGARVPHPTNERASTCNAEVVASPYYLDGMVYVRSQNNVLCAIDPVSRVVAYTFSLDME